jgi:hypothetical protein
LLFFYVLLLYNSCLQPLTVFWLQRVSFSPKPSYREYRGVRTPETPFFRYKEQMDASSKILGTRIYFTQFHYLAQPTDANI